MRWHSWDGDAFRAAAENGRPILLFITTSWSEGCREMARVTFSDPRVTALVEERFIPIHVDAELRPDISDRYALEGWPSTLLLTAEGEILQGGTFLEAGPLSALLERTSTIYGARRGELTTRAAGSASRSGRPRPEAPESSRDRSDGSVATEDAIAGLVASSLDAAVAPKFLHADALVFLLRYGAIRRRPAATSLAQDTLDAADTSPLCADDGRVFRCAAGADWSAPVEEVAPETHAAALRAFAEGCATLDGRYLDRLRRIAAFVRRAWLEDPEPARQPQGPAHRSALPVDLAADLAGAALAASSVLQDGDLGVCALSCLERVTLSTYRPGTGLSHFPGSGAPVLLSDHLAAIAALLVAHDATGQVPYSMLAEELAHAAVRLFLDTDVGAFRDRLHGADDLGRLAEPVYPFRGNALAAAVLDTVARVSGERTLAEPAGIALRWAAGCWQRQGLDAATLGMALLRQTPYTDLL